MKALHVQASGAESRVTPAGASARVGGEPRCPKRMVHGPCGGVQADGSCEVGGPCAFVGPGGATAPRPALATPGVATAAAQELKALMRRRQLVVADLPSPGPDADTERRLASAVAGAVDAVLLGDAPWARLQLPPAVRASIVAGEGVRPWAGLNCRDRNRVALRAELAALVAVGAPAVHCVTGDHPQAHRGSQDGGAGGGNTTPPIGVRGTSAAPGGGARPVGPIGLGAAPGVFDLDSTQLATLAAATGLVVSVAESPAAPPVTGRPLRAAAKAEAGAGICFVNHAGDPKSLAHFVAATRALAPALRIVVCVPMVVSQAGAARLTAFLPGELPVAVREILAARDPVAAAIAGTARAATAVLGIDGVDGVDLSAPAGPGEEVTVARALASVGRDLGGGS